MINQKAQERSRIRVEVAIKIDSRKTNNDRRNKLILTL